MIKFYFISNIYTPYSIPSSDFFYCFKKMSISLESTNQIIYSRIIPLYNQDLLHHLISIAAPQNLFKTDISLLLNPQPRTPSLYLLPKIYKPGNAAPSSPPMVPLVNTSLLIPTPTFNPLLNSSYVQDTNHFLDMIRSLPTPSHLTPPWALLMSLPLYTIPHTHGLSVLEHFLNHCPPHTLPSTQFILTHNSYSFNSRHFLQVKGTAIGTHMAPCYANLFMGSLEQDCFGSQLDKPSLWLRFIDDMCLLWPHGPDSLTAFVEQLDSHYSVHFTWNISPSHCSIIQSL